jgi:epoxide hydrolase
MQPIRPFSLTVPAGDIVDLRDRLERTRWPERECVADWSQGLPLTYAQELAAYWAHTYDWPTREAAVNRFDQFVTEIDGLDIHFIQSVPALTKNVIRRTLCGSPLSLSF